MSGLSKVGMRSNMPMPMSVESSGLQRLLNGVQGFMSNPLIGTGLNMMTGGLGSLFTTGLNMFTQNWANNRQMDMWNEMNEYNTPDAQMQRFLEAGINPAAAVAAVTGGPNTTTEPTMPGNPSQAPDLASLFGNSANAAWDMKVKQMQSREMQANIAVKGLQGEQLAQQTYELQASWNTRLDKMVSDSDISKFEADKLRAFAPYQDMIAGLTRDSMQQTYDNLIEEGKRIRSQIRMQNAQAEVSRSTAKQIDVETGYREWLTNKMKELGYSEGDPMFSYVMAKHDGREDDANALLTGIEKVNHASSKGQSTGSDPVMDEIWAAYDSMNDSSVVEELKKNMDIAYNDWKEFFDTHHDNVNTEEATMYRERYYVFRDAYESANNKNSKEYRKLKEARGIISPEKKLAYDAIGKVLDIGGDIASFYVGGKIMGKGLSSIKNGNPVVIHPSNSSQFIQDINKSYPWSSTTMP